MSFDNSCSSTSCDIAGWNSFIIVPQDPKPPSYFQIVSDIFQTLKELSLNAVGYSPANYYPVETLEKCPQVQEMLVRSGRKLKSGQIYFFFKRLKKEHQFCVIQDFYIGDQLRDPNFLPAGRIKQFAEDLKQEDKPLPDIIFLPFTTRTPKHMTLFFIFQKIVGFYNSKPVAPEAFEINYVEQLDQIKAFLFPQDRESKIIYNYARHQTDIHNCGVHMMHIVNKLLQLTDIQFDSIEQEINSSLEKSPNQLRQELADQLLTLGPYNKSLSESQFEII